MTPYTTKRTIAGTFAVDSLEAPLHLWTHNLLGIGDSSVAVQWAPYGELLDALPKLLRGPAEGGAELVFLLVRLEDLCVGHPELRHAPRTKKTTAKATAEATMAEADRMELERKRRAEYGCAKLEDAETQLLAAVAALDKHVAEAVAGAQGLRVELILFPAPPQSTGRLEAEWAAAAIVAESWLCARPWAVSGSRARVLPTADLLSAMWEFTPTAATAATTGATAEATEAAEATDETEATDAHAPVGGEKQGAVGVGAEEGFCKDDLSFPWYDRQMDRLAHAPFTPALFDAVAAVMASSLHGVTPTHQPAGIKST